MSDQMNASTSPKLPASFRKRLERIGRYRGEMVDIPDEEIVRHGIRLLEAATGPIGEDKKRS